MKGEPNVSEGCRDSVEGLCGRCVGFGIDNPCEGEESEKDSDDCSGFDEEEDERKKN